MIPQLTSDQIKQYLTDPNPIIVLLATYITQNGFMTHLQPSLHEVFTDAPERLLALMEAASGAWLDDDGDISTDGS